MIQQLHQAFGHIVYYDKHHKYFDTRNGKELISVTTWLKQFQPEFQEDYWSKKKAEERGITQEEILKEWKFTRDYAAQRGSYIHLMAEHRSNGKYFEYPFPEIVINNNLQEQFLGEIEVLEKQVNSFLSNEKPVVIKNELILGNDVIAGQCDLLAYYNGKITLFDFKTDKDIKLSNKYQKLKPPFDSLEDTNYSKYILQLSTYKRLLESKTGIRVEEMYIVHFNKDNANYKLYPIKEYQWQA